MTDYKILGQDAPAAGVETNSYSVPATKSAVVRAINVTNTSSTTDTFDIAINDSAGEDFKKFVAISSDSTITSTVSYSSDGVNWTVGTMPSQQQWEAIAYGNNIFVAIGYSSAAAATSTDGITWTARTMPSSQSWQSVTFSDNKFVAVSFNSNSVTASSTDGITWTQGSIPSLGSLWKSVTYGEGLFVAVQGAGGNYTAEAASSTDGITWTIRTLPASKQWFAVTYGNGNFIALSAYDNNEFFQRVAKSTDGITWSNATFIAENKRYLDVVYAEGKFVAVGYYGESMYSTNDGANWTSTSLPVSAQYNAITYGDGVFVAVADGFGVRATGYSTDGITWTANTIPSGQYWSNVQYGENIYTIPSEDYIFKSNEILGNETITIKGGYTLDENNTIRVKSTSGSVTFNIFGGEI